MLTPTKSKRSSRSRNKPAFASDGSDANSDPEILEDECLKDPLGDRKITHVPRPPTKPLSFDRVFPFKPNGDNRKSKPNTALIRNYLLSLGTISKELVIELVQRAKRIFDQESNLVRADGRCLIFGDVHGQIYDLIPQLDNLGEPVDDKWVFLGDYVDRGAYGPEVVVYLTAMKLKYPKNVVMLRGNHETREMTQSFNFRKQCIAYWQDVEVYESIMEMFDLLPVACCINGSYLCMHGGMSSDLTSFNRLNRIHRKREPEGEDMLLDLLWADPSEDADARG